MTLAVIPARGGSKGIPRKNAKFLNGKPLLWYAIETAQACSEIDAIVVTTDCDEIAHLAELKGVDVVRRGPELSGDEVTLDPVVHHAIQGYPEHDTIVTLQPTSPLLKAETLKHALRDFEQYHQSTSFSVGASDHITELSPERVNRQFKEKTWFSTGGFHITRSVHVTPTDRFARTVDVFWVNETEAIDIDTPQDWILAEQLLRRKRILINVLGDEIRGLGHVYRQMTIADRLSNHEIMFCTDPDSIAYHMLKARGYKVKTHQWSALSEFKPHLVINDILDTTEAHMKSLAAYDTINFEDAGPHAHKAGCIINALYDSGAYHGPEYYCLRDEFRRLEPRPLDDTIKNVLITFGGTDPNDYTRQTIEQLDEMDVNITVIAGLGYGHKDALKDYAKDDRITVLYDVPNMSKYIHEADVVITSAGRTVLEVASLGVPLIAIPQNEREQGHNLPGVWWIAEPGILPTIWGHIEPLKAREDYRATLLAIDLKQGVNNVTDIIEKRLLHNS